MTKIIAGSVETINRDSAPLFNETIEDDIHIDKLLKVFSSFKFYLRDKESCPFNRGNWVIDFFIPGMPLFASFSIKLPSSMKEEEIIRWIKPLKERMRGN